MKKPRNISVSPKKGYTFKEPNGHSYHATHPKTLLNKVFEYRFDHPELGYDYAGGWKERFWDDYCKQHEECDCEDTQNAPVMPSLATVWDFVRTMASWKLRGGHFVSQEEAERRASVCLSGANGEPCPHNKSAGICYGCKSVSEEVHKLLGDRRTIYDDRLHECNSCGCQLSSKIWFPLECLHVDQSKLPSYCWQRA